MIRHRKAGRLLNHHYGMRNWKFNRVRTLEDACLKVQYRTNCRHHLNQIPLTLADCAVLLVCKNIFSARCIHLPTSSTAKVEGKNRTSCCHQRYHGRPKLTTLNNNQISAVSAVCARYPHTGVSAVIRAQHRWMKRSGHSYPSELSGIKRMPCSEYCGAFVSLHLVSRHDNARHSIASFINAQQYNYSGVAWSNQSKDEILFASIRRVTTQPDAFVTV